MTNPSNNLCLRSVHGITARSLPLTAPEGALSGQPVPLSGGNTSIPCGPLPL